MLAFFPLQIEDTAKRNANIRFAPLSSARNINMVAEHIERILYMTGYLNNPIIQKNLDAIINKKTGNGDVQYVD